MVSFRLSFARISEEGTIMRCPKCEGRENRVIDSREVRNGDAIRRRRVCVGCGHRFTTYEEIQRAQLQVTKRDGRREELSRDKLVKSLNIACRKRDSLMQLCWKRSLNSKMKFPASCLVKK